MKLIKTQLLGRTADLDYHMEIYIDEEGRLYRQNYIIKNNKRHNYGELMEVVEWTDPTIYYRKKA